MGPSVMSAIKDKAKRKPKAKIKAVIPAGMGGAKGARRINPTKKSPMVISARSAFDVRQSIGKIVGVKGPISIEKVRVGLPTKSVGLLGEQLKVTQGELIGSLNVSKQTFQRRLKSGVLNEVESDRVVRYAQLLALATELFEDREAAAGWLKTPAPALGNETPLVHAKTEIGARNVERLIGRLEHGIPT